MYGGTLWHWLQIAEVVVSIETRCGWPRRMAAVGRRGAVRS